MSEGNEDSMEEMLADAFDKGINDTGSDAVLNELYDQAENAFDNWQAALADERVDESDPGYELSKESYMEAYRAGFYEGIHASERKALFDFVRAVAAKELAGLHAVESAEQLLARWKKEEYNTDPYAVYAEQQSGA